MTDKLETCASSVTVLSHDNLDGFSDILSCVPALVLLVEKMDVTVDTKHQNFSTYSNEILLKDTLFSVLITCLKKKKDTES